jgi:hypothetical protein
MSETTIAERIEKRTRDASMEDWPRPSDLTTAVKRGHARLPLIVWRDGSVTDSATGQMVSAIPNGYVADRSGAVWRSNIPADQRSRVWREECRVDAKQ